MTYSIQRCDVILLRKKWCLMSAIIAWGSRCHYNHVMLAIDNTNIVEIRGRGSCIRPLSVYGNTFLYDIKVMRVPFLTEEQKDIIIKRACSDRYKGKYRNFLKNILMFLFHKPLIQVTCTNFVNNVFAIVGVILSKEIVYTTPKDIEDSPCLVEVKQIYIYKPKIRR